MTSNDERRLEIIKYVMDQQKKDKKISKADVVTHMRQKHLSSGETTHNLIKNLREEGKLNVEEINSQFHFLTVNQKFNFDKMQAEVLKSHIQEALKPFGDLAKDSKISVKRVKKPNSDEYDTVVQVDVEPGKPQKK